VRSRATRGLALCSGVVLNLAGGGLLLWASFLFIFYGYCEDYCDKPERTVAGALGESLPSAIGALALMTAASYVFMRTSGSRRPTAFKALGLGIVSGAALLLGTWLIAYPAGAVIDSDSAASFIVAMVAFAGIWQWATIRLARR
jgi:hypothetical protein